MKINSSNQEGIGKNGLGEKTKRKTQEKGLGCD